MSKEIKKYDNNKNNNKNLIYYKDSSGYESWKEYDKNNNCIHYKDSFGYEQWCRYDENKNLIYHKNSDGDEERYKYNENKNLIHYKDSNDYEVWYKWEDGERIRIAEKRPGYSEVIFQCPECGSNKLGSIENVLTTRVITSIREDGDHNYNSPETDNIEVIAYKCTNCGYQLKEDNGSAIVDCLKVYKWVEKNSSIPES